MMGASLFYTPLRILSKKDNLKRIILKKSPQGMLKTKWKKPLTSCGTSAIHRVSQTSSARGS